MKPWRGVRSLLIAVPSVAVTAAAHGLAGGHVDPILLVVLTAALAAAVYLRTAGPRGVVALAALTLAGQGLGHVVLSIGHGWHASPSMLLLHLGATVGLVGFLARIEAKLFAEIRAAVTRLLIAARLRIVAPRLLWPPVTGAAGLSHRWRRVVVGGRGPPWRMSYSLSA